MDRLIHTALNSVTIHRDTRQIQAQNLANINVPGFRRDLQNEGESKFLRSAETDSVRAFQLEAGTPGFSHAPGFLDRTDMDMDVAIADFGYFYIKPESGDNALSRRGDLQRGIDGMLRNGAGDMMLDTDLQPIEVPQHRSIRISDIGEVYIEPTIGPPGQSVLVGTLATVIPDQNLVLRKGLDGEIRTDKGTVPPPNQAATVLQGVLEGSNVNAVEEMLTNVETQRSFEIGMKVILMAKELDEAGSAAMQAPNA
ncbi:flagellar basal body rod C-terminal domain-containing protein [Pseudoprimorskyibacter insulae]|uniref:Flagellar basal-body rod protein FlgF n=1 Tax=Pseudoprimorskyibacter insulae TaxID=1695997 RepID=A0A2R8AVQ2_9RHOB|nr:flagellar basal body rod C-terminal domain-containing protein [Pseudoprimorskyibacter insulae]SPF80111.1 Flagellar basal-body rod protein FlgF [Pseudoprimorskyibacter insulae]